MCFLVLVPKALKQGWHQGELLNYTDDDKIDDKIDDNDDDDDDDNHDDYDNNDGNGGFFFINIFCRNLVFEAPL